MKQQRRCCSPPATMWNAFNANPGSQHFTVAEHTGSAELGVSDGWYAASKQALDRAYELRDLVEQHWLTPEASRPRGLAHEGRDQTHFLD